MDLTTFWFFFFIDKYLLSETLKHSKFECTVQYIVTTSLLDLISFPFVCTLSCAFYLFSGNSGTKILKAIYKIRDQILLLHIFVLYSLESALLLFLMHYRNL